MATYSCDTGYNLVGNTMRTCQANETWTGSDPTCESESPVDKTKLAVRKYINHTHQLLPRKGFSPEFLVFLGFIHGH